MPTDQSDVFLSHNSLDKPAVEAIKGLLERGDLERGERPIPCWFDKDDLRSAGTWMSQLEEAVATCGAAVVFFGPGGRGPVHKYEIDLLLKRAMYEKGHEAKRLVLVLLPGAQENAVKGFISLHMWADFRKGLDDAGALQRLRALILGEAPKSGPGDDPRIPKPEIEPYRGLEPFERKHATYFLGRDEEIKKLCSRLNDWPCTAVIGGSGSGKSSLVRAGLQTELARRERPALAQTTTITVRPGTNPIRSVAVEIVASLPEQPALLAEQMIDDLEKQFFTGSHKLLDKLGSLFRKDDQHVLLVIDQFEELFTHSTDRYTFEAAQTAVPTGESRVQKFVDLLRAVAESRRDRLRIVITLRADFFDRCLNVPTLKGMIENRTLLLGRLSDEALRTVIETPALQVGAYFEKGLVARILKDVQDQHGSLPLLQHALKELWEKRRYGFLTDDGYDETGGVEGALRKRANSTLEKLTPKQREIAKNVFLRLTMLGEGVTDTRRRVRKAELYPDKIDSRTIDAVLDELSAQANRLIVINDDGSVEVTHEALIQRWDTLKGWLDENRDDKRLHDRLRDAAYEWADKNRDGSYLWVKGRLEFAEKFDEAHPGMLTKLECEFLDGSREAERRRELEDLVRERQLRESVERAKEQTRIAVSRQFAALAKAETEGGMLDRALLLSVEAVRAHSTFEAREALLRALDSSSPVKCFLSFDQSLLCEAFSPDGKTLATGFGRLGGRHGVVLWDVATGRQIDSILDVTEGAVTGVAFSRDGRYLSAGFIDPTGGTGGVVFWDAKTGRRRGPTLEVAEGPVRCVAFSADSRTLAAGYGSNATLDDRGGVVLCDVATGRRASPVVEEVSGAVTGLGISPDGQVLAAAIESYDGEIASNMFLPDYVQLWDLSDGKQRDKTLDPSGDIAGVAFSPDGQTLAVSAVSGASGVKLFDLVTGRQSDTALDDPEGAVTSVAFSPDGQMLAAGLPSLPKNKNRGRVRLWNGVEGKWLVGPILDVPEGAVTGVAFSPDGQTVAAGFLPFGKDGRRRVVIWDLAALRLRPFATLDADEGVVSGVAFSPDGETLAATLAPCREGRFRIVRWDVSTGVRRDSTLEATEDGHFTAVAFSPDKTTVAAAFRFLYTHTPYESRVMLWDVSKGTRGPVLEAPESEVTHLAFSPDGRTLAAGLNVHGKGRSRILRWDVATGVRRDSTLEATEDGYFKAVAFSPDRTTFAAGFRMNFKDESRVMLWDVSTGTRGSVLEATEGDVTDVAFSPDGRTLAAGFAPPYPRKGGVVVLWDIATGLRKTPLLDSGHSVDCVALSPDGRTLAVAWWSQRVENNLGGVILWDITVGRIESQVLELGEGYPVGLEFSPDARRPAIGFNAGPHDHSRGTLVLWDVDPASWERRAGLIANRNFSWFEWLQFFPGEPYRKTFDELPVGPGVLEVQNPISFRDWREDTG
ncbi:MAG: TIR domain-containing protein [Planctomycetota bacterium]|nr:TIR domain-containing protein [Planctomycetota bacterium]